MKQTEDEKEWRQYVTWKAGYHNISEENLLKILVFCFDTKIHYYLLNKRYDLLLDNLSDYELNKAVKRTKPKLGELTKLIKLRRQISDTDLDFMLTGGESFGTIAQQSFELKPSDIGFL